MSEHPEGRSTPEPTDDGPPATPEVSRTEPAVAADKPNLIKRPRTEPGEDAPGKDEPGQEKPAQAVAGKDEPSQAAAGKTEQPQDEPSSTTATPRPRPTPTPTPSPSPSPSPSTTQSPFGTANPGRSTGPARGSRPAGSGLPAAATPGLITAAVGALVAFLAAFLTWATVEVTSRAGGPGVGGGTRSVSGLEGDRLGKLTLVLALAVLVVIGLLLTQKAKAWMWIPLVVLGGLIALLAVLDLVAISDTTDLRERLAAVPGCSQLVQCTGSRNAGIGVYLTVLSGLVVLVGTLLHTGTLLRLLPGRKATPAAPAART